MATYATLVQLRNALAAIDGIQTCKIGLEANMRPEDYPIIRLVPSRIYPGKVFGKRQIELLIYFGKPIHEFEQSLEDLTEELFELEAQILEVLHGTSGMFAEHKDTIADEDRIDAYKLMAIRAVVNG